MAGLLPELLERLVVLHFEHREQVELRLRLRKAGEHGEAAPGCVQDRRRWVDGGGGDSFVCRCGVFHTRGAVQVEVPAATLSQRRRDVSLCHPVVAHCKPLLRVPFDQVGHFVLWREVRIGGMLQAAITRRTVQELVVLPDTHDIHVLVVD